MDRLGIFGGTFDPPHVAHLIAGELAVETFVLDRLLYIPANIPPHKTDRKITPRHHRLAMTRLATQDNPHFEVSDIEITRTGTSYTIDTLHALKEIFRPKEVYLFIGLDNLATFNAWHKPEEILAECKVIVMARPSHTLDQIDRKLRERVGLLPMPLLEISSTDIRERVKAGKSIRYLLPDSVRSYIAEQELYK